MQSISTLKDDFNSNIDVEKIFHKHVVDGQSYFFRDIIQAPNLEYDMRYELAKSLDISISDVIIVGSAKLGYSLKSEQFNKFNDKSDIDIAIINRKVFDSQASLVFNSSCHFEKKWIAQNWAVNYFYRTPEKRDKANIDSLFLSYVTYLAKGWFRIDLTPNMYIDHNPFERFKEKWRKELSRKVSIGLYSDWSYLKDYQVDNLNRLKSKIYNLEVYL